MNHATTILHMPDRADRLPIVHSLRTEFPDARILPGIRHAWIEDTKTRCVTGALGSHARAIKDHLDTGSGLPLLILEDDADITSSGYREFRELEDDSLPHDCLALLVGGEAPNSLPAGRYHEVMAPVQGVHALLVNTPVWRERGILAEMLLASLMLPIGEGDGRIGLESLYLMLADKSRLPLYRLSGMPFGTRPSYSERLGAVMAPRTCVPANFSIQHPSKRPTETKP